MSRCVTSCSAARRVARSARPRPRGRRSRRRSPSSYRGGPRHVRLDGVRDRTQTRSHRRALAPELAHVGDRRRGGRRGIERVAGPRRRASPACRHPSPEQLAQAACRSRTYLAVPQTVDPTGAPSPLLRQNCTVSAAGRELGWRNARWRRRVNRSRAVDVHRRARAVEPTPPCASSSTCGYTCRHPSRRCSRHTGSGGHGGCRRGRGGIARASSGSSTPPAPVERAGLDARQRGHAALPRARGCASRVDEHLVPGPGVRADRDQVAHRAGRDVQRGLLAGERGDLALELDHGRIVAPDVVADHGRGHRFAHLGRGPGDGVRAKVDRAHGGQRTPSRAVAEPVASRGHVNAPPPFRVSAAGPRHEFVAAPEAAEDERIDVGVAFVGGRACGPCRRDPARPAAGRRSGDRRAAGRGADRAAGQGPGRRRAPALGRGGESRPPCATCFRIPRSRR